MKLTLIIVGTLLSQITFAFSPDSYSLGVGYYSQNILNKTSQSETGETKLLGEASFPITLKYDFAISPSWYLAPQFGYTLLPRKAPGSTADITLMQLSFLFGQNFSSMSSTWDWYFGPGFLQQTIKGKGGTMELPNGNTTATFAVPGGTSQIRKVTLNLGSSYSFDRARLGLDLIFENAFSSTKRTQSLMFSASYLFGGGIL